MKKKYLKGLSIAGSDSGGGAGIQADLRTFHQLGVFGLSAITAITAQNTLGVKETFPLHPSIVKAQLEAVWEDMGTDVIKVGMLGTADVVLALAAFLENRNPHRHIPVILDPVLYSTSGVPLLDPSGFTQMIQKLLPLTTLVTPNLMEASLLSSRPPISTEGEMEEACRIIHRLGPQAVLLKGGHLTGDQCSDCLFTVDQEGRESITWFRESRIRTPNNHGTGCVLASAIASYLVRGGPLENAVRLGKAFVGKGLLGGRELILGRGKGPLFTPGSLSF